MSSAKILELPVNSLNRSKPRADVMLSSCRLHKLPPSRYRPPAALGRNPVALTAALAEARRVEEEPEYLNAEASQRTHLEASYGADAALEMQTTFSSNVVASRASSQLLHRRAIQAIAPISTPSTVVVASTRRVNRAQGRSVRRVAPHNATQQPAGPSAGPSTGAEPSGEAAEATAVGAQTSTAGAVKRRRFADHGRVVSQGRVAQLHRSMVPPPLLGVPGVVRSTVRQPGMQRSRAETFLLSLRHRLAVCRSTHRTSGTEDAVQQYMASMGDVGILAKEEEVQLSAIIHLGQQVQAALAELTAERADLRQAVTALEVAQKLGLKSAAAVQQRLANAEEAKDLMVQFNMRLVLSICKKYVNRGIDMSDLIPEGAIGLVRAVDRFDASKGFKFSTYAYWWVRQAVSRTVTQHARVVRLPVHVFDHLARINKVVRALNSQPGRQEIASYAEIGQVVGMTASRVQFYMQAARQPSSLDAPLYKNSIETGDLLVDSIAADESIDERARDNERVKTAKEKVDALLSTLTPRDRNVLRFRYGIVGPEDVPYTLNEVGALYGLKGERIRQIEYLALNRLRYPERRHALQQYLSRQQRAPGSLV